MPKVLIIINRLNIGGPASHAAYLTKYLAPEFETMLLSGQIDGSEGNANYMVEELGLQAHYIPDMHRSISPSKDYKAYQQIKKVIQDFKPDVVHTHAAKPGALGRLAASNCGVPVIIHTFHGHVFHSYFSPLKTRFFLETERRLARKSSAIIAISPLQKKELTETFKICPSDKMKVIPLGYDLRKFYEKLDQKRQHFRKQWQVQTNEIAIGIVGRLVPIKNHSLFLQALKRVLSNTSRPIKAFVIGDGESRAAIEEEAKSLNIPFSDSPQQDVPLIFTSWIKEIELAYAGLDVVCLSSLNEGTPVSLIEAQAANCSIVSTDVGGVQDIVDEQAKLSPSGDVAQFAQNLLDIIKIYDYKIRSQTLHSNKKIKEFELETMIKRTKNLYFSLLKNQKSKL